MKFADLKNQGFDWNSLLDFCKKNIRYISAGAIVVVLVIVLAVATGNKGTETGSNDSEVAQENVLQMEAFKEDAIPEINTLIENYYAAYAAGDVAAMESCAAPISDTEKSYITLMSGYIKEYTDIKCYTKPGLAEGEYAVSVVMNMSFEDAETSAPGLDFFYVKKNTEGVFYIDNLYSQFNLQNQEQALDSQVEEFIEEYEQQEDMLLLCDDVESRYAEVMTADEKLKNIAETVIPEAIQKWVAEITGTAAQEGIEEVFESVYITENVNIRKKPKKKSKKIGSAVAGQEVIRIGITDNGWSKIEFDGKEGYIKNKYLSTEEPVAEEEVEINYVPEGKVLTMNSAVNVRKTMEEDGERIGTTEIGDEVEVILSYAEGWTKVKWNGETGYIKTELLLNN